MHFPRNTILKKQEHDHLCNYEKNFRHWIVNISFIFSIFKEFSSGSVWELYLLSVIILIALFCNFMSLCVLKPHSKMLLLKCGAISELYMILRVYFGRKCFRLFLTPNVRDILFAMLSIYRSQFSVSCILIPRKTNFTGDTGKQKTDSKTHCFSLKRVPLISLHDVVRYYMICRFV